EGSECEKQGAHASILRDFARALLRALRKKTSCWVPSGEGEARGRSVPGVLDRRVTKPSWGSAVPNNSFILRRVLRQFSDPSHAVAAVLFAVIERLVSLLDQLLAMQPIPRILGHTQRQGHIEAPIVRGEALRGDLFAEAIGEHRRPFTV